MWLYACVFRMTGTETGKQPDNNNVVLLVKLALEHCAFNSHVIACVKMQLLPARVAVPGNAKYCLLQILRGISSC